MSTATAIERSYDPSDPYGIVDGVATRWLTKDKRNLLMADMEDRHLMNTIRFLERQVRGRHEAALGQVAVSGGVSDAAAYYAVGTFCDYARVAEPVLKGLRAEAQRRGLPELVP